jgi:hypothetical protein
MQRHELGFAYRRVRVVSECDWRKGISECDVCGIAAGIDVMIGFVGPCFGRETNTWESHDEAGVSHGRLDCPLKSSMQRSRVFACLWLDHRQ